jgi:hypothetical protein
VPVELKETEHAACASEGKYAKIQKMPNAIIAADLALISSSQTGTLKNYEVDRSGPCNYSMLRHLGTIWHPKNVEAPASPPGLFKGLQPPIGSARLAVCLTLGNEKLARETD